jgi:hypothetical protein
MFLDTRREMKDPELSRTKHPTKCIDNFNLVRNSENSFSSSIIATKLLAVFASYDAVSKECETVGDVDFNVVWLCTCLTRNLSSPSMRRTEGAVSFRRRLLGNATRIRFMW